MAWLEISPGWADDFHQLRLETVEDFLRLEGVILSGHPLRHVQSIQLEGIGPCILKKEHGIPWTDRLENAWAGFGWASKSRREASVLRELYQFHFPVPEVLAVGEARGRSFILFQEARGYLDLRQALAEQPQRQLEIIQAVALELGKLHRAGFIHGDLYSKHILVGPGPGQILVIDWQRARRSHSETCRLRDLATLHATLADDWLARPARLQFLKIYAGQLSLPSISRPCRVWARKISTLGTTLQRQRKIQELRRPALPPGQQNLIWLDGERRCVTRQFQEECGGSFPPWLRLPEDKGHPRLVQHHRIWQGKRSLLFVQRTESRLGNWLKSCLRRRTVSSPEFEQAAAIFRLERFGLQLPRLLAVGHDFPRPWRSRSFLLVEPPAHAVPLLDFLKQACRHSDRHRVLRSAGEVLAAIHRAGFGLAKGLDYGLDGWAVREGQVVLVSVAGLVRRRGNYQSHDLEVFLQVLKHLVRRSEILSFQQAYGAWKDSAVKSPAWLRSRVRRSPTEEVRT